MSKATKIKRPPAIRGNDGLIYLPDMSEATVQLADVHFGHKHNYHRLIERHKNGTISTYAVRTITDEGKRVKQGLAHDVMGVHHSVMIDHINGNTRDNRRCNLRLCTASQNNQNKRPSGVSVYLGVYLCANKWRAMITLGSGKKKHLYYGLIEKDAADAYDDAAVTYYGHDAFVNDPVRMAQKRLAEAVA